MTLSNTPPERIDSLVRAQRTFFATGVTRDVDWRRFQLKQFNAGLKKWEKPLCDALWKDLRKAFQNMPKAKRQRKYVSAPINDIRVLRNRVFHNESISWSLSRLEELHESILEVCSWINPTMPLWIKTVERFDRVVRSVKRSWYGWLKFILR